MGQATPSATYMYFSCMLSSQATCVIVSGFRAALDLDTYPLSNFIRPRCAEQAKPSRGKPVLIMHIGFFACFTPYLSNAVVSAKSPHCFSCPCSTEAVGIALGGSCAPGIYVYNVHVAHTPADIIILLWRVCCFCMGRCFFTHCFL